MGRSPTARLVLAAVAAIGVAELAVWALRPRPAPPEPAEVQARDYFTGTHIERAEGYRGGQLALGLAGTAIQGGVLVVLALGRPRRVAGVLGGLDSRPLAGAAAAGAALSVVLAVASLPTSVAAHERAVDAGLSTQGLGAWLADYGKSAGVGAGLAAVGATALIALVRRLPRTWWVPGSVVGAALAVLFIAVAPVTLSRLFNDFDRLPESELRSEILALADRAGVEVGEVYTVDASRRVSTLNAYVGGLGPTKRVVLYDNLLARAERPEIESVVAHELAHVSGSDLWRGLAFVAAILPAGLLFVQLAGRRLAVRGGADPRGPSALPAYALAVGIASAVLSVPGNQLSRAVEAEADREALELTGDPAALVDLQQRLAVANLSDPDPPAARSFLLRTHPGPVARIGAAVGYAREDGIELPAPRPLGAELSEPSRG